MTYGIVVFSLTSEGWRCTDSTNFEVMKPPQSVTYYDAIKKVLIEGAFSSIPRKGQFTKRPHHYMRKS